MEREGKEREFRCDHKTSIYAHGWDIQMCEYFTPDPVSFWTLKIAEVKSFFLRCCLGLTRVTELSMTNYLHKEL